jgi:predicted enzyme related to lactoylglutathione lyase
MTVSLRAGAVVYAKDLATVAAFYQRVAGLRIESSDDGFVMLGAAHLQLGIVQTPDEIARAIDIAVPAQRREDTAVKLLIPVADIAAARDVALEAGGVVDPPDREWSFDGYVRCDGHDPEGNVIQVIQVVRSS